MSPRSRAHPWFHDLAPRGGPEGIPVLLRDQAEGDVLDVSVKDFQAFGTLVSIGPHQHHFPPRAWDRCFPRPPAPPSDWSQPGCGAEEYVHDIQHFPTVAKELDDMTTVVDETKPKDDTKPASKAGKPPVAPKNYKERLPCKLTDPERLEVGNLIVLADDEVSQLEDQKKEAADGFKARIELAEGKRRELVGKLRSGTETRLVDCIERFVWERGAVQEIRTDTNAVLSERAMTADERQGKLPLDEAPPPRKADAAPPSPSATDITVTPDLLAGAEKAVAEDAAAGGAVPPKRRPRTPKPAEPS